MNSAFLEDFKLIKVFLNSETNNTFYLDNNPLITLSKQKEGDSFVYFLSSPIDIFPHIYHQLRVDDIILDLSLGKIARSKEFDEKYYFADALGLIFDDECITFRLWAPLASEVILVLNDERIKMDYKNCGVYEKKVADCLIGSKYYYLVKVDGTFKKVLDPYSISYTTNFNASLVVDINKTRLLKNGYVFNPDPIIEEISIRDATSFYNEGMLDSTHLKDVLKSLKEEGINTIQIMPIFGYGGVNEERRDYNWGYNPVMIFAVSNIYANSTLNPYFGLNALKELIDYAHSLNLSVVLDVVYNHTFDVDNSYFSSCAPGYAFFVDQNGYLTNASGCGNDFDTTKKMVQKYILDNLCYFTNHFKIDGFRFDLMGLLSLSFMKEVEDTLRKINPNILLYGEGWQMSKNLKVSDQAIIANYKDLINYSFFNDSYRDYVRNVLCLGKKLNKDDLEDTLLGNSKSGYLGVGQSINYYECHDNMTLADFLSKNLKEKEVIDYLRLAIKFNAISLGTPLYLIGSTTKRSKKLSDNSYNLGDDINMVRWNEEEIELKNAKVAGLALRSKIYDKHYKDAPILEIEPNIASFLDDYDDNHQILISSNKNLTILIKNDYSKTVLKKGYHFLGVKENEIAKPDILVIEKD